MTKLEFQAMCREASQVLRLSDVDQLGCNGQVEVQGHPMGAFYDEDEDDAIHCFVDLGPLAGNDRMSTLEQVLALNLELGRMHGESLGLDPASGHIVLRSEIKDLESCTAERMAEWLQDYAGFADEFRGLLDQRSVGEAAELGAQLA